jgi:hypothetical protein
MNYCAVCGEQVILSETTAGVKIMLRPEPQPLGLLYINVDDGKVKPWTEHTGRSVKRYESHSYNCPGKEETSDET